MKEELIKFLKFIKENHTDKYGHLQVVDEGDEFDATPKTVVEEYLKKNNMKSLKIYKYQAETIDDALRLASRTFNSKSLESCMDRDIVQAKLMIEQVLKEEPDNFVTRFGKVERK